VVFVVGSLIDSLSSDPSLDLLQRIAEVNDFVLILVCLSLASFVTSYLQSCLFLLVGNRQINRIRQQYLTALLRQEISWYDLRSPGELTTRVSSDIPLIRDGISEKVGSVFQYLSMFISGFVVSFVSSWKVALVTLAVTPILIVTIGLIGRVLTAFSARGQRAYSIAGGLAEEVSSPFLNQKRMKLTTKK